MKNIANWLPLAILSPIIIAVALSIIYWVFVLLPKYICEQRSIRDGKLAARKAEQERVAKIKRFKATEGMLDLQVIPRSPRMRPEKKVLYSNQKTGTLVYQVFTSNMTLPDFVGECFVWAYFLIGNADGFVATDEWLDSEAEVDVGGVLEDDESVVIKLNGYKTIHFGIEVPVKDMVFRKAGFKPYPDNN